MQKITTLSDFLCTCQNQLPISSLCRVIPISQIHVLTRSLVTRKNVLHFSIQWLLCSVSLYRIQSIIRSGQKVSYHNAKFISNTSLVLALSLSCFERCAVEWQREGQNGTTYQAQESLRVNYMYQAERAYLRARIAYHCEILWTKRWNK